MKKVLLLLLVMFSVILGFSLNGGLKTQDGAEKVSDIGKRGKPLVRVALVSDSGGENELLRKALRQAQGKGINFVIGLGDFTEVGTRGELSAAKRVFDDSGLEYYVTSGDHDLWDSRNRGEVPTLNFSEVFGDSTEVFEKERIQFILLDNSDIYLGIDENDWRILSDSLTGCSKSAESDLNGRLCLVFAHKTPFHPSSSHVFGSEREVVANQAENLISVMEEGEVSGFFSGDLHFFAEFKSPSGSVRMTTVGATASERNFQGPRFGILTVFDDYSWEVEDVEIR